MPIPRFNRPVAKPVVEAPKKHRRFGGIRAASGQTDIPRVGVYRFEVLAITEGHNEQTEDDSFKISLRIVTIFDGGEGHAENEAVIVPLKLTGKAGKFGRAEAKSFVMAAAGFEDEAEYDEYDPDGDFIEACLGDDNAYSNRGDTLVGRLVDGEIKRGKDRADGDYWRRYTWGVVPDSEQAGA